MKYFGTSGHINLDTEHLPMPEENHIYSNVWHCDIIRAAKYRNATILK